MRKRWSSIPDSSRTSAKSQTIVVGILVLSSISNCSIPCLRERSSSPIGLKCNKRARISIWAVAITLSTRIICWRIGSAISTCSWSLIAESIMVAAKSCWLTESWSSRAIRWRSVSIISSLVSSPTKVGEAAKSCRSLDSWTSLSRIRLRSDETTPL